MKKKGFTLAEVLVTLGIIGVVAALAMPALNSAVQKTKVGPTLRKFMNAMENTNRIAMQEHDVDDLYEAIDDSCTKEEKDKNGKKTCVERANIIPSYLTLINSNIAGGSINATTNTYTMSSGEEFKLEQTVYDAQADTNYKGSIFKIIYDMNGFTPKPNTPGKDQFYFLVDKNGSILPKGSDAAEKAYGTTNASKLILKDPNTACDGDNNKERCAGAIANNGWKVGYKY